MTESTTLKRFRSTYSASPSAPAMEDAYAVAQRNAEAHDQPYDEVTSPSVDEDITSTHRVSLACSACRARKCKCDGNPAGCRACAEEKRDCIYVPVSEEENLAARARKRISERRMWSPRSKPTRSKRLAQVKDVKGCLASTQGTGIPLSKSSLGKNMPSARCKSIFTPVGARPAQDSATSSAYPSPPQLHQHLPTSVTEAPPPVTSIYPSPRCASRLLPMDPLNVFAPAWYGIDAPLQPQIPYLDPLYSLQTAAYTFPPRCPSRRPPTPPSSLPAEPWHSLPTPLSPPISCSTSPSYFPYSPPLDLDFTVPPRQEPVAQASHSWSQLAEYSDYRSRPGWGMENPISDAWGKAAYQLPERVGEVCGVVSYGQCLAPAEWERELEVSESLEYSGRWVYQSL